MTKQIAIALAALALAACTPDTAPQPNTTETTAVPQEEAATASLTITEDIYPHPEKQPNFGPRAGSISFTDTDPGPTIGGTLTMDRAVDANGVLLDETEEGISAYMIHWGLEVGAPGTGDDAGNGDLGGNCRGFRDTGHVVMIKADAISNGETLSWDIPQGTKIPEDAIYFVGHTLYGEIHNLAKCTQTPIDNLVE